MSFLSLRHGLVREMRNLYADRTDNVSTVDLVEKGIKEFCNDLEAEGNATLRRQYADIVAGYQVQLAELRRKKYILFANEKQQKAEALLAKVEMSRDAFTSKLHAELEHEGLWESLNEIWAIRPPPTIVRKLFERDGRSSPDIEEEPQWHGPKLSDKEKKAVATKEYKAILRRTMNPRIRWRTRKQPREFDPDLANRRKAKDLGSGVNGQIYTIVINDDSIREDANAVYAVKKYLYDTPGQKSVMANECELLERTDKFMHIINLVAFRFWNGIGNCYMEYVSGGDLSTMVNYVGPIAESETKPMLRQVLNGLKFLQERRIVHRNLKGTNILISLQGLVKIRDLSFAKDLSCFELQKTDAPAEADSRTGSVLYMSPELASGHEFQTQDPCSTDIWSLGCIIVEMMSGIRPWPTFHEKESDLRYELSLMYSGGCPIEGPPLEGGSISLTGKQVLESIFGVADTRPTAADLLEHDWLRRP